MRIIIFPFAGGSKYSFNNFFSLSNDISILEYPGRGLRIKEDLIKDINELVSNLLLQVKKELNSNDEYIIYGHSMGALVGYLICQKLEELNLKRPIKLVVSGRRSPRYLVDKVLSNLPNENFWEEVSKLGGIPENIKNHPELIHFFAPLLKADFECIEKYQYNKNNKRLTIPIDVFYGSDEDISEQEAKDWQMETSEKVTVKELSGNHFFIFDHKEFFTEYFKNILLNATI